ncbi:MAG: class I SAM-dependent DNA methyltransferase [Coriobacteriales bacterium]|nr:class I SAM-dependent DNA methyltransferase [Coriobacteriales bacterium]
MDWNDVLPAEKCSYVIGNPPFLGYANLNEDQKCDRATIFGNVSTVDYVACWYAKASEYSRGYHIRTAFVSTNSICQGQQVKPIWDRMFAEGNHIDFAWRTFVWNNEASDQAHVHCIIVGFSREVGIPKTIFLEDSTTLAPTNINGYLEDKSNISLERRTVPICNVLPMTAGGKPSDGQNLILEPEGRLELISKCPKSEEWIKPFSMGAEFINGNDRYCLWLVGITKEELESMPPVCERVEQVREMRLASKKEATRRKAETPWLFDEVRPPQGQSYIAVPKVSSGRRVYVPMGFVTNGMIPGDKLFFISDAGLYEFGILESQFHNAWIRIVAGRLKSDYSYSNTIVYNNFVWPGVIDLATGEIHATTPVEQCISSEQREHIESCAQAVLNARENHPGETLATLYDPNKMPADLLNAHKALDAAVETAYGVNFGGDEEKIVAHLFKLYAQITSKEG